MPRQLTGGSFPRRRSAAVLRVVLCILTLGFVPVSNAAAQELRSDTLKHYLATIIGSVGGRVTLDGRHIAFVDWSTGNVAVNEIATGEYRHLTHKGSFLDADEYAMGPRISLDGRRVAYMWFNAQGFYELRVVGIDGSGERVLYRNEEVPYLEPLDWSPDGRRILVGLEPREGSGRLVWISSVDGELEMVRTLADGIPNARCSPDVRYIAYDLPSTDDAKGLDIHLLDTWTGEETLLVARDGDDRVLDWTPGGKALLFVNEKAGEGGIWIVQVIDGERRSEPLLVHPVVPVTGVGFTREGTYYYCCGPPERALSGAAVFLVDRDPRTGRLGIPGKTIQDIENKTSVAWSPDGERLALVRWNRVFTVVTLESGEERAIPTGISRPRSTYPRWTPDGRSLIAQGRSGLYRVDIESGVMDTIVEAEDCCFGWPVWLSSGRVFYTRWKSEKRGEPLSLMTRDPETAVETELYGVTSPLSLANLTASPDDRWLAFVEWNMEDGDARLKVMAAEGGEPRNLLTLPRARIFRKPLIEITWTPDSRHIVYAVSPTSQPWSPDQEIHQLPPAARGEYRFEFWQIAVTGGDPQPLGLTMDQLIPYGLSIAPDGRRLAFTAGPLRPYDPVWALENFLPSPETR